MHTRKNSNEHLQSVIRNSQLNPWAVDASPLVWIDSGSIPLVGFNFHEGNIFLLDNMAYIPYDNYKKWKEAKRHGR